MPAAADVLAEALVGMLQGATALVPIPRTAVRRHRYGVDPGFELARSLARRADLPMIVALRAALWGRKHAGVSRDRRVEPTFHRVGRVPEGAILVDDVITTGVTIATAARVSGIGRAVTATSRVR
jgi:predicted amidophosphoribosyltransferase